MNITLERFNKYHQIVGEDFVDQNLSGDKLYTMILGFMLAKLPEYNTQILEAVKTSDLQGFQEEVDDSDIFYSVLVEFINLTVHTKEFVNTRLEEYNC